MDIDMKIDTDIDIDMETKNWKHLCLATYFRFTDKMSK